MTIAASSSRKTVSKSDLVAAVDALSQYSSRRGLSPEVLEILIEALTKHPFHLDQGVSNRLIKTLIPRKKVSQEIVLKIVGCLGSGANKPPLGTQVWWKSM